MGFHLGDSVDAKMRKSSRGATDAQSVRDLFEKDGPPEVDMLSSRIDDAPSSSIEAR